MSVLLTGGGVVPSKLPPIGTPLNDMTWEQISEISNLGLASTYFNVGDTKTITINGTVGATTFSNLSIDAFILGINHNPDIEGANKIHFGLGKIGGVDVALCDSSYNSSTSTSGKFIMNTSNTNVGGWASSHMRKTVLGSDSTPASPTANTLLVALPAELLAVLKPITKYSDNVGNASNTASNITVTTDYLPLLSEFEVFGTRSNANTYEQNYQKQYEYFKAGNSKIKYKHNATTSAGIWWLRSSKYDSPNAFITANAAGNVLVRVANYSHGVAPAFAV